MESDWMERKQQILMNPLLKKTQSYPSFAIREIAATVLVSASRCSATVQQKKRRIFVFFLNYKIEESARVANKNYFQNRRVESPESNTLIFTVIRKPLCM